MENRAEIQLRQADSSDSPDLLRELKRSVEELFQTSVSAATDYVRGKGQQELAKSAEIKAKVLAQLGQIELERQRLVAERAQASRKHEAEMYALKTSRLQSVVECLLRLKSLGVEVDLTLVAQQLTAALEE